MKWIIIALLFLSRPVYAATNTAASTTSAAVQAAIDASSDGDTVNIPSGTSTWTTNVTIEAKGLRIFGAGTNSTKIVDNNSTGVNLFDFRHLHTGMIGRLSSLTISGGANAYSAVQFAALTGNTPIFRADHLSITNLQKRGISTSEMQGLVDHCYFICPTAGTGVSPDGQPDFSSNQWAKAMSIGTTNCVVVEDCVFGWLTSIANGVIDMYSGNACTFRQNIVTNGNIGAHGTDSGGSARSITWFDAYSNSIYCSIDGVYPFSFRGGSVQIHGNQVILLAGGTHPQVFCVWNQYRNTGINVYQPVCCNPFGPVSGTNVWDGNTDQYGYPAMDQLGRIGPTTYGATNTTQVLSPCYVWNNLYDGTNNNGCALGNDIDNTGQYAYIPRPGREVQKNRDWFEGTPMPGYTPLAYPHPLIAAMDLDITISGQPQNTTTGVGIAATFTVTASGGTTLHYQWVKNGSNAGTDSSAYSITPSSADNGASVYVAVSDVSGSLNSTTATLTVTNIPATIRASISGPLNINGPIQINP